MSGPTLGVNINYPDLWLTTNSAGTGKTMEGLIKSGQKEVSNPLRSESRLRFLMDCGH